MVIIVVTIICRRLTFGMPGVIACPGIGLKRRIEERHTICSLDEFRTSCLSSRTGARCENLKIIGANGRRRRLHPVLSKATLSVTFQMENKRKGCINRDLNAVSDMRIIVEQRLVDQTRPARFCRDKKS